MIGMAREEMNATFNIQRSTSNIQQQNIQQPPKPTAPPWVLFHLNVGR
jgi:hypothetical protein